MNRFLLFSLAVVCTVAACNENNRNDNTTSAHTAVFASPEAGTLVPLGDSVQLQVRLEEPVDSIIYLVDDEQMGKSVSGDAFWLKTQGLRLGSRLVTANVFYQGKEETLNTNIVVMASKAPAQWSFSVENAYPHDVNAYTQGLEYHDGVLYESTGQNGKSSLRKVELQSGKVLQRYDLPEKYFGEGLTVVGDKIIQLTWEQGVGFVYDKATFTLEKEFPYQASAEGWGLCFDGTRFIKSDGSNRLYFLNKDSYREEGYIEVFNNKGAVNEINELEYINGKVFANIYYSDIIVVINPETGEVEAELDLTGLLPKREYTKETNVLNGIAYNKAKNTLYVTGKNWPKLFEIKMLN
ncbi:glutaminyl-peptide cyclotransferase [Olivibacter sitiensis]|uniref:glutaminyl-peptide cyclotransferase n=1 Tax=Olivibacter sitiensis TaxID=376470 RepID=UPI001FE21DD3|nr:glutaminyl-peptide cyclotransferase [Olivibacter sitiensis]